MPTLYILDGCPYCEKVMHVAERLGVELRYQEISDVNILKELMARGGKRQVPYLVDEAHGASMYESDDIITYLEKTYGRSK